MTKEWIYVANNGDVVVTSAKDKTSAKVQIEKELGVNVSMAEISRL